MGKNRAIIPDDAFRQYQSYAWMASGEDDDIHNQFDFGTALEIPLIRAQEDALVEDFRSALERGLPIQALRRWSDLPNNDDVPYYASSAPAIHQRVPAHRVNEFSVVDQGKLLTLRWPRNARELRSLGNDMANCVADYNLDIVEGTTDVGYLCDEGGTVHFCLGVRLRHLSTGQVFDFQSWNNGNRPHPDGSRLHYGEGRPNWYHDLQQHLRASCLERPPDSAVTVCSI